MTETVPLPTPDGSCTTTSYSDVRITDKLYMQPEIFPPNSVSFTTKTNNQDKPPSLSAIPTIQVPKSVTHIDSNITRVPEIITKVMICSISGDPM